MKLNYENLSKELSYALRHAPLEYNLKLDDEGWVEIKCLLDSFQNKSEWTNLTKEDLVDMIEISTKKRHEIKDNKIRAVYGHSTPEKIQHEQKLPPEV